MKVGDLPGKTFNVTLSDVKTETKKSKSKSQEIAGALFLGVSTGFAVVGVGGLIVFTAVQLFQHLDKVSQGFDRGAKALETAASSLTQLAKEPEKPMAAYRKVEEFCKGLEVFHNSYEKDQIAYPIKDCMKKVLALPDEVYQGVTAVDLPNRVGSVQDYCKDLYHRELFPEVCNYGHCSIKFFTERYRECVDSLFGDHGLFRKIIA